MFNVYVPDPIYERLPRIYLLLAAALVFAPLAQVKWLAVAALVTATMVTRHQRQIYREALRMREALNFRQNLQYEPTFAVEEAELSRTYRTGMWKSMPLPSRTKTDQSTPSKAHREDRADTYRTVLIPTSSQQDAPSPPTRITLVRPQVRDRQ